MMKVGCRVHRKLFQNQLLITEVIINKECFSRIGLRSTQQKVVMQYLDFLIMNISVSSLEIKKVFDLKAGQGSECKQHIRRLPA